MDQKFYDCEICGEANEVSVSPQQEEWYCDLCGAEYAWSQGGYCASADWAVGEIRRLRQVVIDLVQR